MTRTTPPRPDALPDSAVFDAEDNEWTLGQRDASGRKIGHWTWWRPDGVKISEASYDDDGRLHGRFERWHESGEPSQWATYVHGKVHGVQVWTRPTTGPADKALPPNLPDRVIRMDVPYVQGVAQPMYFTFFLEAGRRGVPVDDRGRCLDLAAQLGVFDLDTVLLPVVTRYETVEGQPIEVDPTGGRWIYKGHDTAGVSIRHQIGTTERDHVISHAELSRAFTLAADYFLTWLDARRPPSVHAEAVYDTASELWQHGPAEGGQRHGTWLSWRPDGSLRAREAYVLGVLEGPFERFHPDGSLARSGTHHLGEPVGRSTWCRATGPSDEPFVRSAADAVARAEEDHDADTTTYALADGRACTRRGVPYPEAWHDDWFAAGPEGFLAGDFVRYLDAFFPREGDDHREALRTRLEHLWGHPPAADLLTALCHAVGRGEPRLVEWRMAVDLVGDADEGERNTFEVLVACNQDNYLGYELCELFAGVVWVGSLGNGDGYLVSVLEPQLWPERRGLVYLFDHEERDIGRPVAIDLDHLAYLTAVQDAWTASECIRPETLQTAIARLAGRVRAPWHFASLLETAGASDLEPLEPESADSHYLGYISGWIIGLLRGDDLDDVQGAFDPENFPVLEAKPWPERLELCAGTVSIGLYWMWRLFFFGDDARVRDLVAACKQSPARLLRDSARLLEAVLDGRREVGAIEDIHALRAAFIALDLDPARAQARAAELATAEAAAEQHAAEVAASVAGATDDTLLGLAWTHVDSPVWLDAIAARWRSDGAPTWGVLDRLAEARSLAEPRSAALADRLKTEADPRLPPLLVGRVLHGGSAIDRELLVHLAPPEAAAPLLTLLTRDAAHRHGAVAAATVLGIVRDGAAVPQLAAALSLPVDDGDAFRHREFVMASITALGRIGTADARRALVDALGTHPTATVASALADAGAVEAFAALCARVATEPSAALLWALARLAESAPPSEREALRPIVRGLEDLGLAATTVRAHLLRVLGDEVHDLSRWVRTALAPETVQYGEDESIAQKVWALRVAACHDDVEPEVILAWTRVDHVGLRRAALVAATTKGLTVRQRVLDEPAIDAIAAEGRLEALHAALLDRDAVLAGNVVARIAAHRDPRSGPVLLEALRAFVGEWHALWGGQDSPELLGALLEGLRELDAPQLVEACRLCLEDGRGQVVDPVLRESPPVHAELLPGIARAERMTTGWKRRSATEWLDAYPDAEAVKAARGG